MYFDQPSRPFNRNRPDYNGFPRPVNEPPAREAPRTLLLCRQDLGEGGEDRLHVLVGHLALAEGVVHLDLLIHVEEDRHVGLPGEPVVLGAGRVVDRQHGVADLLLAGEVLELLRHGLLVFGADDHEAAHLVVGVLGRGLVDLLDQTGQGAAQFPGEDQSDRTGAVESDLALLLAGVLAGDVERLERVDALPDLGAGLQRLGGEQAAGQKRQGERRPDGDARSHGAANLRRYDCGRDFIWCIRVRRRGEGGSRLRLSAHASPSSSGTFFRNRSISWCVSPRYASSRRSSRLTAPPVNSQERTRNSLYSFTSLRSLMKILSSRTSVLTSRWNSRNTSAGKNT